MRQEQSMQLPAAGHYAVGQIFLPQNARQREQCKRIAETVAQQLGRRPIATRQAWGRHRAVVTLCSLLTRAADADAQATTPWHGAPCPPTTPTWASPR
jgi:glutamate synthase domain-containing protein 1